MWTERATDSKMSSYRSRDAKGERRCGVIAVRCDVRVHDDLVDLTAGLLYSRLLSSAAKILARCIGRFQEGRHCKVSVDDGCSM